MQHIIVRTSEAHHLIAPDWHVNGAGYKGIPYGLFISVFANSLEKMNNCMMSFEHNRPKTYNKEDLQR